MARGADRTLTAGVQLLADLREVFGGADKVATSAILDRLHNLPELAWRDIRGKALDDRGLARRLGKYGVKPKKLRPHPSAPAVRGYEAADLADAWSSAICLPPNKRNKRNTRNKRNKERREEHKN